VTQFPRRTAEWSFLPVQGRHGNQAQACPSYTKARHQRSTGTREDVELGSEFATASRTDAYVPAVEIHGEPTKTPHGISYVALVGRRHFHCPYKHEAQASEYLMLKHTCLRCVLVISQIPAKVALSD
jgi:hypothetical protein